MSSSSKKRRRSSSRGGRPTAGKELTRSQLADATLAVIADVGAASLTRARVAEVLGVSVRALYRLAPSSEHLIAVAAWRWQRRWQPPQDTGAWIADLRQWCVQSHAHAAAYPGLTAAAQRLPTELLSDEAHAVTEAVVGRLVGAGFDPQTAGSLYAVLSMHCLGWAVVFPDNLSPPAEGELPDLSWREQHLELRTRGFELGLDLLLEGIASKLERARA